MQIGKNHLFPPRTRRTRRAVRGLSYLGGRRVVRCAVETKRSGLMSMAPSTASAQLSDGMRCKYALVFGISSCIIAYLISVLAGGEVVMRVDPVITLSSAYFNQGNALLETDTNEAMAMYQEALQLYGSNSYVWSALGKALESAGNESALLAYTGALHVLPSRARNYYHVARLAPNYAIEMLQHAVKLSPLFVHAHYALAIHYMSTDQTMKALQTLQHILYIQPSRIKAKIDYCALLYAKQNPVVALSCFSEVSSVDNQSEILLIHLAHIYLRSGAISQAQYYFSQAASLHNSSIGLVYQALQDPTVTLPSSIILSCLHHFHIYYDPLTYTSSYNTPHVLAQVLEPYISPTTRFLDLGSGMGHTCDILKKHFADASEITVVGVDFSPTLITLSSHRYLNCYTELMHRDMFEFLAEYSDYHFDIVYAADTLAYVDIVDVLDGMKVLLHAGAIFAFNVDRCSNNNGKTLLDTLRYGYSDVYMSKLTAKYGLDILISQEYVSAHVDSKDRSFVMYVVRMRLDDDE